MKKTMLFLFGIICIAGCKNSGWTADQKQSTIKQCINGAAGVDNATAQKYCNCFLDKMMQKYPVYADAEKNGTEEQGQQMGQACAAELTNGGNTNHGGNLNGGGWTKEDEDKWMNACSTGPQDKDLCNCALKKLEKKYANFDEANTKGTTEEGQQMRRECEQGQ